jgi:hypothetical protein
MAGIGRGQVAGDLETHSSAKAGSLVHGALLFDGTWLTAILLAEARLEQTK